MNAMTLYQIADEYRAVAERLADLEMDEQTIADTLEGISGPLEEKATAVAAFARNLESSAEAIKSAETEMAKRRKAIEARASRIRFYLQTQMQRTGISRIESPWFKLALRDNPPFVAIDNEDLIPEQFMRSAPPPPAAPDKATIAAVLKAGGEVPGAHLERTQRLEIR